MKIQSLNPFIRDIIEQTEEPPKSSSGWVEEMIQKFPDFPPCSVLEVGTEGLHGKTILQYKPHFKITGVESSLDTARRSLEIQIYHKVVIENLSQQWQNQFFRRTPTGNVRWEKFQLVIVTAPFALIQNYGALILNLKKILDRQASLWIKIPKETYTKERIEQIFERCRYNIIAIHEGTDQQPEETLPCYYIQARNCE